MLLSLMFALDQKGIRDPRRILVFVGAGGAKLPLRLSTAAISCIALTGSCTVNSIRACDFYAARTVGLAARIFVASYGFPSRHIA